MCSELCPCTGCVAAAQGVMQPAYVCCVCARVWLGVYARVWLCVRALCMQLGAGWCDAVDNAQGGGYGRQECQAAVAAGYRSKYTFETKGRTWQASPLCRL